MIYSIKDGKACITVPVATGDLHICGKAEAGVVTRVGETLPVYKGSTVVTPTRNTQVLYTKNHKLLTDIIINPIPKNYGLISRNGSVLIVS